MSETCLPDVFRRGDLTLDSPTLRPLTKADIPLLDQALRALSADLGDPHHGTPDLLMRAAFAPTPVCYALIADHDRDGVCGAVVFSPLLSTTLGTTGLYVSDLWVAEPRRGEHLGQRLLAAAARQAERDWGAGFLKLTVYKNNAGAYRFYERLGFQPHPEDIAMFLDGDALSRLKGQT